MDAYDDVIENNKPKKWHRVKVIRRLQRLIQLFVRENTRLHFKVKAITYETYTMDDHQCITMMEDLKSYTDGDALAGLKLFPVDDILYIEHAFKLLSFCHFTLYCINLFLMKKRLKKCWAKMTRNDMSHRDNSNLKVQVKDSKPPSTGGVISLYICIYI